MKKIVNIGIMILMLITTFSLASCSNKKITATGSLEVVAANRYTLELKASIVDDKSEITTSSIQVVLYDADDAKVTSQTCTTILSKDEDENVINSQTVILTGLSISTEYTAKLQCTIGDEAHTLSEITVSTTANGSSEDTPIEISTSADFSKIKNDLSASYVLTDDIDLSSGDAKTEWSPLFSSSSSGAFTGTFDGGNHTISGFKQTTSTTYYGFFGYISEGATIKNLTIDSAQIKTTRYSDTYAGFLGGFLSRNTIIDNVNITNCELDISTTASQQRTMYIGGLAGKNEGATITNSNVTSTTITSSPSQYAYVGGFIGANASSGRNQIADCTANTTIKITQVTDRTTLDETNMIVQSIGGFVGLNENSGNIIDCQSEGTIEASLAISQDPASVNRNLNVQIGGFVGNDLGIIRRSLASNSIDFTSFDAYKVSIGLFCGYLSDSFSLIENCAYIGSDKTLTLTLVDGDNDKTTAEKNEYERIFNVGAIGYISTNKTADDYSLYVVIPATINMSSAIEDYSLSGTTDSYSDFELTDAILASITRLLNA